MANSDQTNYEFRPVDPNNPFNQDTYIHVEGDPGNFTRRFFADNRHPNFAVQQQIENARFWAQLTRPEPLFRPAPPIPHWKG